jgi:site-specific recombinase XerD
MTSTELVPSYLDVTRLAIGSFLARYREPTLTANTQDLKAFLGWCQRYDLDVLRVSRGELEMYVRHLEGRGYAAATVARRFGTVATFYKYAVIDGVLPANPAAAVTRPKVAWEGQKRTVLHPLEFATLPDGLRAVREVVDGRTAGPILRTRTGRRMDRAGASRALTRVARAAGITRPISPHGLRRTFCTTGLVAGISIRDMQHAMRHADPRTTMRYDMAKANLNRHAAHAVAAYLAGMSTG